MVCVQRLTLQQGVGPKWVGMESLKSKCSRPTEVMTEDVDIVYSA